MRERNLKKSPVLKNKSLLQKTLEADEFEVLDLSVDKIITINLVNRKFRSISQAVGRASSAIQRFTNDRVTSE